MTYAVDKFVFAVGRRANWECMDEDIIREISIEGKVYVDADTMETKIPGFFIGGDTRTGPNGAVEAVMAGESAAISIDHYIRNNQLGVY